MNKVHVSSPTMGATIQQVIDPQNSQVAAAEIHVARFRPLEPPHMPHHLQIEIITHCNLGCIMCPRTVALAKANSAESRAEWFQTMPIERYTRILDQAVDVKSISLHGLGEPLMHPHIFELVERAVARNIAVRFTSNLTLLTPDRAERMVRSGLHRLIVSLDGATASTYESIRINASFDRLLENLSALLQTRRTLGIRWPRIDVNMVVCAVNQHQVSDIVRLCHRLGVESLMLSPVEPTNAEMLRLMCDPADWIQLTAEAREEAERLGLSLYIRGEPTISDSPGEENDKQTWRCMQPWSTMMIMGDGSVMPCCNIHDRKYSMGNILTEELQEIWTGAHYQTFRKALRGPSHVPAPCNWCPDF
mgnify:CR=1 FL=1